MEIAADVALEDVARQRGPLDTVVVVGGFGAEAASQDPDILRSVTLLSHRAERTASVCTGAFVLGAAGLLDGYRATSHWGWCNQLAARCPGADVLADQIYVHDRDRWTSAGVTAVTVGAVARRVGLRRAETLYGRSAAA